MAHVLIIEARFYEDMADELARGATEELKRAGATFDCIAVPGVLEIPAAIKFALDGMAHGSVTRHYDGFIALGCVIRGETTHYEIVSNESARALMDMSVARSLPLGNGIQTVENDDQAWARVKVDKKNKGGAAAKACLAMIELKRKLNG
jgi:6,7-dimethyl-8-ribityllumazine synthase